MMTMAIPILCAAMLVGAAAFASEPSREKVILDTDMVEGFDDGVAMLLLANSPAIDLIGVTTVAGNTWAQEGVAYALRQLEVQGRPVPVFEGALRPLRPGRQEMLDAERALCGMGHDGWVGCFGSEEPESWRAVYQSRYGQEPSSQPEKRHAVEFIIDAVRANPHQVTIAAVGPCTNLALALRQAPDIAPLIKRIVYMGGSFFKPGNVTPAAEFNWWFDPEAARIAVRADIPEQIVFGLDVCEKLTFKAEDFHTLLEVVEKPYADLLRTTFLGGNFLGDPDHTFFIWDVLVAAMLIDESLITDEITHRIDINDSFGLSYGQSLAYPSHGPAGSRPARIVLDIDQDRFWSMLLDPKSWKR
ncbi:MAG: nucleoside hydrolase [Planctomycetaceae bacterium]|nr:nucleoside hydrolase [Planctomycetaceae bacterium]